MWAMINLFRKNIKLGVSVLVWDWLLLFVVMLAIAGLTQEVMHPALPIIGVLWVLATAATIWHLGGIAVDSLFLAKLLKEEIGTEFTRALNVFFFLGSTTVIFFSLFPIWKFWAATFILPIVLVGIFTTANLANKETAWIRFYRVYVWLAAAILFILAIAGIAGWFKTDIFGLTPEKISFFLSSWTVRLFILGLVFWGLSLIPKIPTKILGFLRVSGSVILIIVITIIILPEVQAKLVSLGGNAGDKKETIAAPVVSKNPEPVTKQIQIPSEAKFVATVMLNDRVCMERESLDGPPPKFFVDLGGEIKSHPWPTDKKQYCATNKHRQEGYQLYIYAEPGQSLPVASKTVCLLDETLGKK
ncbi:MAG TPA: hypothetical protein P5089_03540 [Candidatus Portnoybacteria bacterium]|nr:hypothetical protein [Candidatus Portnoybacteria bacterium]